MRRGRIQPVVDVMLLVTGLATLATGMVLFLSFHGRSGAFRTSALGLARITWLNLHRLPAPLVVGALGLHLALNWSPFLARLRRAFSPRNRSELVLYVTFWTVAFTGLGAWLLVGGSPPLSGPAAIGLPAHGRRMLLEVHHIVGLATLGYCVHHVGHRWRRMVHALGSARRAPGGASSRSGRLRPLDPAP